MNATLRSLFDLAGRHRELRPALDEAGREGGRRLAIAGLNPAAAAVLIAGFVEKAPGGKVVLLVPGEREAEQFRSDLSFAATAGHSTALPVRWRNARGTKVSALIDPLDMLKDVVRVVLRDRLGRYGRLGRQPAGAARRT